ncbi:MAG TPA: serine hydrolase, partial [Candidatus Berkiella sp.]|nr:serine hydrolase [Candidatus Berkiella sp.]
VKNPKAVIVWQAKKGKVTNTNYGLGWHSMNYGSKKVIYHQGHLKGFRNFMGYVENDVGIIILTNAEKKHASTIALNFFDLYLNAGAKGASS